MAYHRAAATLVQKQQDFRVISLRIAGKSPSLREEVVTAPTHAGSPLRGGAGIASGLPPARPSRDWALSPSESDAARVSPFGFSANLRYFCIPSRFFPAIPTFSS